MVTYKSGWMHTGLTWSLKTQSHTIHYNLCRVLTYHSVLQHYGFCKTRSVLQVLHRRYLHAIINIIKLQKTKEVFKGQWAVIQTTNQLVHCVMTQVKGWHLWQCKVSYTQETLAISPICLSSWQWRDTWWRHAAAMPNAFSWKWHHWETRLHAVEHAEKLYLYWQLRLKIKQQIFPWR